MFQKKLLGFQGLGGGGGGGKEKKKTTETSRRNVPQKSRPQKFGGKGVQQKQKKARALRNMPKRNLRGLRHRGGVVGRTSSKKFKSI